MSYMFRQNQTNIIGHLLEKRISKNMNFFYSQLGLHNIKESIDGPTPLWVTHHLCIIRDSQGFG
jgi:hypothetical protein